MVARLTLRKELEQLLENIPAWNKRREENPNEDVNLAGIKLNNKELRGIDFSGVSLHGANLSGADLQEANLERADLTKANLEGTSLQKANLQSANLHWVKLKDTQLQDANLNKANIEDAKFIGTDCKRATLCSAKLTRVQIDNVDFSQADLQDGSLIAVSIYKTKFCDAILDDAGFTGTFFNGCTLCNTSLQRTKLGLSTFVNTRFSGANLKEADISLSNFHEVIIENSNLNGSNFQRASFINSSLEGSSLDECKVYGTSAWDVRMNEKTSQRDLIITPDGQKPITIDNLKIAQFIYLILNNQEIRHVIDTITSKVVLILGRFTEERKQVLDTMRNKLREKDFLPIMFDFEESSSRNLTETVSIIAHMACFVIADITDPKSIPQELQRIVPSLPSLPVQPLILDTEREYGMFKDFRRYSSLLPIFRYSDIDHLLASMDEHVIKPAINRINDMAVSTQ